MSAKIFDSSILLAEKKKSKAAWEALIIMSILSVAFLLTADILTVHGLSAGTVKEANPTELKLFSIFGYAKQPLVIIVYSLLTVCISLSVYRLAERENVYLIRWVVFALIFLIMITNFIDMLNDIDVILGGTGFAWFRALFGFG